MGNNRWYKSWPRDHVQGASTSKNDYKKKTFRANERDLEKNKKRREDFKAELETIHIKKRIYIDESGTNLGMSRTHGRSAAGERAYAKRPGIRGGNISLVGAIRLDEEPTLYPFDGPVDEDRFLSFLDRLIPSLNDGDVVIMDNCSIHKTESVKVKLATVGARPLFLPPYSPELNPVEEAWSLAKSIFKSLEARTISAYIDVLGSAKAAITPEKIEAYFKHSDSFLNLKEEALLT